MLNDDAGALAVNDAQTIVNHARWCIYEEQALARLVDVSGLSCTRLFPRSAAIQVVAVNGVWIGRVRHTNRDVTPFRTGRWVAVPSGTGRELGCYRSLRSACRALARAAGQRWVMLHRVPADAALHTRRPTDAHAGSPPNIGQRL
jgi:hypothetical protein